MKPVPHKPMGCYKLFLIKISLLFSLIAAKSCEFDPTSNTLPSSPILLLISLDGFAADYLNTSEVPHLDSLMQSGVAGALVPVFPTKTFPNHYTQVTGLYPENHGIVSNRMYDEVFDEFFTIGSSSQSARDEKWYQGEPIWTTASKHGLISATMFWPGSDVEKENGRPDYYYPYNGSISVEERVNQALAWLAMNTGRPNLITLYFEKIDQAGHIHGPDKKPVRDEISRMDNALGQLMHGIVQLGLADVVNIVITSDHGMIQLSGDRVIFLDDYLELDQVEIINWTPLLELTPLETTGPNLYDRLKNAHPHLKAYLKQDTPEHWHYKDHHRIPAIVAQADAGWSISSRDYFKNHPESYSGGAHGYDPQVQAMHGIFIGSGPAFQVGAKLGATESVHLYQLLCKILEIKPALNDGDLKVWEPVLNR